MKSFSTVPVALVTGAITLGLAMSPSHANAQASPDKPTPDHVSQDRADHRPIETFPLKHVSSAQEANEITTAVRIMLDPQVKVFLTPTDNTISVRATTEELTQIKQLLIVLDHPKKSYRLTYTLTESEAGKRIGVQHFTINASSGNRSDLKQGSKVPIVTGSYDQGKNGAQTQFTYLDVGVNFDATVEDVAGGVSLKSKVEQSSIAPEPSGVGGGDPIVRQSMLEGTYLLTLGKPLTLGSLDISGSPRHLDVEVLVELNP